MFSEILPTRTKLEKFAENIGLKTQIRNSPPWKEVLAQIEKPIPPHYGESSPMLQEQEIEVPVKWPSC